MTFHPGEHSQEFKDVSNASSIILHRYKNSKSKHINQNRLHPHFI